MNGVVTETEFYKTGETPLDKNGNKIPKVTYVERTEKISVEVNECKWTEIPLTKEGNVWIAHQMVTIRMDMERSIMTRQQHVMNIR